MPIKPAAGKPFEYTVPVVVVGAGAGGLTAALAARRSLRLCFDLARARVFALTVALRLASASFDAKPHMHECRQD